MGRIQHKLQGKEVSQPVLVRIAPSILAKIDLKIEARPKDDKKAPKSRSALIRAAVLAYLAEP